MSRKGRHGFTLIELLVVIAMIAILAAMIFPACFAALKASHRAACSHNLQEIAQGVEFYRQDSQIGYPAMPNYIGDDGIQQGGVTQLALSDRKGTENYFWCKDDLYPKDLPSDMWSTPGAKSGYGLNRDETASSYSFGYNYYGYVTATDGIPFPITTREAFVYFMGEPRVLDNSIADQQWDLGVVKPDGSNGSKDYRNPANNVAPDSVHSAGVFQGLSNGVAPAHTIVTFCSHHVDGKGNGIIPVALLSGESMFLRSVKSTPEVGTTTGARLPRHPDPNSKPPIDWRANKAVYRSGTEQKMKFFGDTPNDPLNMPVVYVNRNIFFRAEDLTASGWYNTRIPLQAHDVIMVVAEAKWSYRPDLEQDDAYKKYRDETGNLYFSADGDEKASHTLYTLNTENAGKLIGSIGGPSGSPFPLGSRGFSIAQSSGDLCLSMNDIASGFTDNRGWCRLWIAVYRP